jgi:uncharacterized repeat protein (TIGR04138 family)
MSFWDAVYEIRRRDPRFDEDAYAFVMDALEYTISQIGERRHVSAAELLHGLCDCAKARFGMMAWTVLERWGVQSTTDIGTIVFQLVESGVLSRQDSDERSDFDGVMDLETELEDNYFEAPGDSFRSA